jgi:hypothetical protein
MNIWIFFFLALQFSTKNTLSSHANKREGFMMVLNFISVTEIAISCYCWRSLGQRPRPRPHHVCLACDSTRHGRYFRLLTNVLTDACSVVCRDRVYKLLRIVLAVPHGEPAAVVERAVRGQPDNEWAVRNSWLSAWPLPRRSSWLWNRACQSSFGGRWQNTRKFNSTYICHIQDLNQALSGKQAVIAHS